MGGRRLSVSIFRILLQVVYFRIQAGNTSTADPNVTVSSDQAEEVEPIESILNIYRANHGYKTLLLDEHVCSRQYVVGGWSCHQIARHTLGFLDILKDAVLSNQTFLAKFCESGVNERECTITPRKWVPTVVDAMSILEKKGCTERVRELLPYVNGTLCASSRHNSSRDGIVASLSSSTANLNVTSTYLNLTAKTLDMYGPEARYGGLFLSCFDYNESVIRSSDLVLNSSLIISGMGRDKTFIIGIHARHSSEMISSGYTKYVEEKDCIKHVLLDTRTKFGDRYCILIVSTDRNHTLVGLSTFANSIGCEVLNAKEKKDAQLYRDDGFAMIADLHLLSQVDYFLGSTQGEQFVRTPFSSLVASLVAYNQRGTYNILWVPSDTCDRDTIVLQPLNASLVVNVNTSSDNLATSSTKDHMLCNPRFLTEFEGRAIKGTRGREVFFVKNW